MNRDRDAAFWDQLPGFDPARIDERSRTWNAEKWARRAQMEHASIASFSKFALQLIAVGAPPALIVRAHESAIDEVHHARYAFAITSRFLGRDVGPGPLQVAGDLLGDVSLTAVVAETVREGCVGETLAAAEAAEAGAQARDPAIAAAMACIAADEQAHAELAWTVVSWAVQCGGGEVLECVRRNVASAVARFDGLPAIDAHRAPDDFGGYGHLTDDGAQAVRRRAVAELILPVAAALGARR